MNETKECVHNATCLYATGFYCEDCHIFFKKNSATYRKEILLDNIWNVLHNLNIYRLRNGEEEIKEVLDLKEKIGIGKKHDNYEEIIHEAEILMKKYGVNSESAMITLK